MDKYSAEICKHLDKIAARGYDFPRVYDDFLTLSCAAFSREEEEYMKITKSYPNDRKMGDREADHFKTAFHAWQDALKDEYSDYLGRIYEERVSLGEKGQFFTPESIAAMMTKLQGAELNDWQRVSDPACGSGRLLLEATRLNRNAYFHGIDLDHRCVKMTSLNLLCRNVDGAVIWGDGLTLKAFGGYELSRTPFGGAMERIGENRANFLIRAGLVEAHTPEPAKQAPVVEAQSQTIEEVQEEAESYQYSMRI
jgi:type I restriction-modification system DNA methylase subunit